MHLSSAARALARPMVRLARELPVRGDLMRLREGRGPLAVFLPSRGPEDGAALLRIHHIARALPSLGWRCLVLPWRLSLVQRQRLLAAARPDILVMQGVRHDLNRPAYYRGHPILFDMDDADFHLPHLSEAVRRAMPEVAGVIAGSSYVADWCLQAGAPHAHVVWTGAPVSRRSPPPQAGRPPVLAWAQTRPMTYVHEADLIRRFAHSLAARHPGVILRLFDRQPQDDPAFAETFHAPGLSVEWYEKLRYRDFIGALDDVALGLAPLCSEAPFSRGKSFGKVLAYLDAGVPVIASDACENGAFFQADTGVVSNAPEVWVSQADRLLNTPDARQSMADAARIRFRQRLSTGAAATRIDRILRDYIT